MFAIRRVYDDPIDTIPVPPEFCHRKTEVIFIALERDAVAVKTDDEPVVPRLAALAGCWEGELEREPQGAFEVRREFE